MASSSSSGSAVPKASAYRRRKAAEEVDAASSWPLVIAGGTSEGEADPASAEDEHPIPRKSGSLVGGGRYNEDETDEQ